MTEETQPPVNPQTPPAEAYPQQGAPQVPGYAPQPLYQQPQYPQQYQQPMYVQPPVYMQQPQYQQPMYVQPPQLVPAWKLTPERNTLAITGRTLGFIAVALWAVLSTANIVTVLVDDYRFERSMLPISVVLWIATWAVAIAAIIIGHIAHSRSTQLGGTGQGASILAFSLGYGTIAVGLLVSVFINTLKFY